MTTIEHIEDASRFAALAGEWDALLQHSDAATVFRTWEWQNAWWTHLRGGRRLHLLAVRVEGRLAAVAPLALAPPRLERLVPFRTLQFLGAGAVGSDYLDVIAERDAREPALTALAGVLGRERWMLELGRVAAGGALALELSRALQERSWTSRATQRETCPFIDLAGHTWDSYLGTLGSDVSVHRNDKITVRELEAMKPQGLLISPGPGEPRDAGITEAAIQALAGKMPILGVCLGHQALGEVYGGRVIRAPRLMHGKTSPILHKGRGLFAGLDNPFEATRYHSLIVERESLPDSLEVMAWTPENELMGIKHKQHETWGVQFHPESILTTSGLKLIENFLTLCRQQGSARP